jgi:hypothetical protein
MPTVLSKDIYGTTYSLGFDSAQAERVVRRHYVEGETTMAAAVNYVNTTVTDFNTLFPLLSGMPLQNISAKQIGVNRFLVEQVYGWSASGSWGGSSYNTLAEFRLAYESCQCYTVPDVSNPITADGLPPERLSSGSSVKLKDMANANDAERRPQPYSYNRPVLRIGVPKNSTTNPMTAAVVSCMGKVNSGAATVAGLSFAAKTLRFDGGEFIARSNTGFPFQGTFTFTGSYSFKEQRVEYGSGTWLVYNVADGLATANFTTAFGI